MFCSLGEVKITPNYNSLSRTFLSQKFFTIREKYDDKKRKARSHAEEIEEAEKKASRESTQKHREKKISKQETCTPPCPHRGV